MGRGLVEVRNLVGNLYANLVRMYVYQPDFVTQTAARRSKLCEHADYIRLQVLVNRGIYGGVPGADGLSLPKTYILKIFREESSCSNATSLSLASTPADEDPRPTHNCRITPAASWPPAATLLSPSPRGFCRLLIPGSVWCLRRGNRPPLPSTSYARWACGYGSLRRLGGPDTVEPVDPCFMCVPGSSVIEESHFSATECGCTTVFDVVPADQAWPQPKSD